MKMSFTILGTVFLGILCGFFFVPESGKVIVDNLTPYALYILMVFVGFDLGHNRHVFKSIKKLGIKILLIPVAIVIGSLIGGYIAGIIFNMATNESLAISAGLGWYSLSGILLKEMASAELGAIAFLTNVVRELIAFISIPILAKYFHEIVVLGPAGATSMDTTLPIISKYTRSEMIVISVLNGMILSMLVAPLVTFVYNLGV